MIKDCLKIQELIFVLFWVVLIYRTIGYFKDKIGVKFLVKEIDELLKENVSLVKSLHVSKLEKEKLESDNENLKLFSCSSCKNKKL